MKKNIIEIPKKNEVAIKMEQNDFADLILNFLGKKEKISYHKNDIEFKVRLNDIEQFYYLLDAKIKKESYTDISHFSITIYYSDNTNREINGIQALNKFLETRDVIPKAIILSWNILLSFPDSVTIENQKIDVVLSIREKTSFINITVEHTNPLWGKEVLNLLEEHCKSLIIKRNQFFDISYSLRNFLKKHVSNILTIVFMVIIILVLLTASPSSLNSQQVQSMSKIIDVGKASDSDAEIQLAFNMITGKYSNLKTIDIIKNNDIKDILINQVKQNKKESSKFLKKFFSLIAVLVGIVLILMWLLNHYIKYYSEESFILITTKIEKIYKKYEQSKSKLEHYSLFLIAFSIIVGLIVNALYQFMVD